VQPFFDAIPDVRWEIFEASSHMPFIEEPDATWVTVLVCSGPRGVEATTYR